ncbi:MAG: helix-turn-helix domain-containing protein [Thermaerobacter sp.]|nr:helix-turn-helix domain-containing protein [Thermaerobacter sp.]
MKRYFVIDKLETLRAISQPVRVRILHHLLQDAYTGKQLSDLMGASAPTIHYHLRELEEHGLIEVIRTEEKNGIMQKFFRVTALDYVITDTLLPALHDEDDLVRENAVSHLRMGISRAYAASDHSFRYFSDPAHHPPVITTSGEFRVPRTELEAWVAKFQALIKELCAIEERHRAQMVAGGPADDPEKFFLVAVGFMAPGLHWDVEEDALPAGYRLLREGVVTAVPKNCAAAENMP